MKLLEVFRFEVEYRVRSASTWLYALLLLGVGFALMQIIDGSSGYMNRPHIVAVGCVTVGMVGMLVTAALFADAAVRDVQARMHPLVYTTPIRTLEYLGGRFLGALVVNAVLLLGVPLGLLLGSLMPHLDPKMFGPFIPGAYVEPYLLFLLPNAILGGALLFTVAALTRQVLPAYLGAIGLFLGYLFSMEFQNRITHPVLGALADPFGLSVLGRITRYWTPAELNSRLIGLPDPLLWNRLAWMGVAAAVLAALLLRFRFVHQNEGRSRVERKRSEAPVRAAPAAVPPVAGTFGARTRIWQTLWVARRSLGEVARNPAFALILVVTMLLVLAVGWDAGSEAFGTSTWPVTHLIAATVLGQTASVVVAVLIALLAGELVWRERDVRVSQIEDAAPVPTGVFLAGRFLALAAALLAVQAALMASGVLLQTLQGYHRYELGLYLRILFGIKLVDYLLLAALAMAVHVVVNQKYLGHLVVVLFFLFTLFSGKLGIEHNLLRYNSDPGWIYSDMNGFGAFMGPWGWFKLYWAGWALLLAAGARLFWVRGREEARLRVARTRFAGAAARAAVAAAVLIVATGGFIFYNTNVLNEYRTPEEALAPWAEYERRYGRYEHAPQPRIEAAQLRVEIRPRAHGAELRGSYRLVNRTGRAIDSVHVLVHPEVRVRSISFDRAARPVLDDGELQYQIYALARPLAPGDSLRLRFDVRFQPRGFSNGGAPTAVVGNGAYFDRRWLPFIGYQPGMELTDAKTRGEQGLAPRPPHPAASDPRARQHPSGFRGDAEFVPLDAIVGTDADQTVITPGTLVREWTERGRRYFHYRAEGPLSFGVPIFSARYAEHTDRWNGTRRPVSLRVLHHPAHDFNLDRIVRGMKAALDYNTASFGPYPARELRVVEIPRYSGVNRAHPHTIAMSEGGPFLTRVEEGDLDRPFFVVAHETAHQWWGGQVRGAAGPGKSMVSETLAQYSAMMAMEKALGRDQVRRFYDYEMDNYLQNRGIFSNREVPLLDVDGQAYVYYHKGAVAMYTLREQLGEARVNAALRRFLDRYRDAGPPYPTSRDLYAELRAATPDSLRPLLRDLFEEITLWDVRAEAVRVEPAGRGFRVTLDVVAKKVRADSVGVETEVPMDDGVEIGVFGAASGDPLYLRRHRIRSGRQSITVVVPRAPDRAGIDPFGKLIQRKRDDNVVGVETAVQGRIADR